MIVVHSRRDFLDARAKLPAVLDAAQLGAGWPSSLASPGIGKLAVVLTMGALHAGHAALMAAAREQCDSVVTTVFINPLQFGERADLDRYPRSLAADVAIAAGQNVDLIWAPDIEDVYSAGPVQVTVDSGPLGSQLEGAARPGHFNGMLTVVAKFLNIIRPDYAYFGEKDFQQLTLIRRMVADLDLGIEIVGVPTVREPDGLALSSRNVFLSSEERHKSLALSRALTAGQRAGSGGALAVQYAAQQELMYAGIQADYLALRANDLSDPRSEQPARLLVAARIGRTRLIDNVQIERLGATT